MNSNNPDGGEGNASRFYPAIVNSLCACRPLRSTLPFIWIVLVPFVQGDQPHNTFGTSFVPLKALNFRFHAIETSILSIFMFRSYPCLSNFLVALQTMVAPIPSLAHFLVSDRKMYFRFHFRSVAERGTEGGTRRDRRPFFLRRGRQV